MIYRLPILNTCDIIISYCVILQLFVALIAEPTDHLIPPTNPPKALPYRTTNADQTYSYNTNIKNKIPLRIPVQDAHMYLHHNQYHHHPQQQRQPSSQSSQRVNFMTRIARWLGFNETPYEQKTSHGNYAYPQPNQTISNAYDKKASCNLCNKYPWVPLLSTKVPWHEQSSHQQQQLPYKQAASYTPKSPKKFQQPQQFPLKQRALQFNYSVVRPPAPIQGAITNIDNFVPMPVSNLRSVVLPLLHNHHNQYAQQTVNNVAPLVPLTVQELPSTDSSSYFSEAVGAHSELQSNRVRSTNHPQQEITTHYQNTNNHNNDVEFIKSHQLTDFVTSVEYPATFVESHTIDLLKPDENTNMESSNVKTIDTVMYKLNDLNAGIHKYVPASHLLTEHGTYISGTNNNNGDQTTTSVPISKQTATISTVYHHIPSQQQQQQQQQQSLPFHKYYETDNYPSASSQQQQQQEFNTHKIHFEAWQALQNEYYDGKKHTQIPIPTTPPSTKSLPYEHSHSNSNDDHHLNYAHHLDENENSAPSVHKEIKNHMEPEIPKQSFDLPNNYDFINKNKNAPPRPFTLNIALPNNYVHSIHHNNENQVTPLPVISTPQILQVTTTTPASNSMQDTTMKTKMHQVVIPYKRRHKPRPFQPTQPLVYNGHSGSTINYNNKLMPPLSTTTNDIEQQESKVVSLAAEHPSPHHTSRERQSSKFLTKILASNLRELLKHEREMKQTKTSTFDLIKLRRNIDGWTEQEYTSLSHRPSTPMIRGHSKHIPSEYLSTTTTKTKAADFDRRLSPNVSELSTSINNLEHLLISEEKRASNHYVSHINDNSLVDYFDDSIHHHHHSIHSTTTPLTPTTTKQSSVLKNSVDESQKHIFRVSPSELWKKAKVAVTAHTKENVYVVTPQPRLLSKGSPLTSSTTNSDLEQHPSSKASRFLLPKIQKNASNDIRYEVDQQSSTTDTTMSTTTTTMLYSPDYFGLVGLSSYVPADPVEIIDGNSKVNFIQSQLQLSDMQA